MFDNIILIKWSHMYIIAQLQQEGVQTFKLRCNHNMVTALLEYLNFTWA